MTNSPDSPSRRFGSLFCAVLNHGADRGEWGYCDQYFDPAGTPSTLGPMPSDYRVLVVPGIFGQCIEDIARPFEDARPHLLQQHGLDIEHVTVSALGSTTYDARQIAEYLNRQFAGVDHRPYIVVGYSKGASDILEAVSDFDSVKDHIAAIVTMAGSVLGSRLAEGIPGNLVAFLQGQKVGPCEIGDGGGVESLRRSRRVAAMAAFKLPSTIKAYSVAAVSTAATTSAVLLNSWLRLQSFSLEQDSQMLHEDAIIPGAAYLGIARGDHWAIALPFEYVPDAYPNAKMIHQLVNRNHYPRATLLEAALRYALAELPHEPK